MWVSSVNAWLDRLPHSGLRIGPRVVSPWALAASAGLAVHCAAMLLLAGLAGRPLAVAALLPALSLATCLALGWVRRRLGGEETHVLLEGLLGSLAAVTGALVLAGADVLGWLDLVAAATAAGLTLGRLGCASHGCCHGVDAELGIYYPPWAIGPGRRFPVQLLEAALWAGLALGAAPLALRGPAGAATSLVLVGYGAGRFALEALRGDPRPAWGGWSESRWLGVASVLAGLGLDALRGWDPAAMGLLCAGGLAALALLVSRSRWLDTSPALPDSSRLALQAFGEELRRTRPSPRLVSCEAPPLGAQATWVRDARGQTRLVITLRRPDGLSIAEARVGFATLATGLGGVGEPSCTVGETEAIAEFALAQDVEWDLPAEGQRDYFGRAP
jgi:hypothetical protein